MQMALWIKEKNEETGKWESSFWKAQMQVWRDEQPPPTAGNERIVRIRRKMGNVIAVSDRSHCGQ